MTDTMRVTLPAAIHGGGTITMREFTTRDLLAIMEKKLPNIELLKLTMGAVVTWLPGKDPLDLPPDKWPVVLEAWMVGKEEEALPPVNAEPSAKRSSRRRSATAGS